MFGRGAHELRIVAPMIAQGITAEFPCRLCHAVSPSAPCEIILIPLAVIAVVVAMLLLGARERPPTPVGPVLTMSTSLA